MQNMKEKIKRFEGTIVRSNIHLLKFLKGKKNYKNKDWEYSKLGKNGCLQNWEKAGVFSLMWYTESWAR